MGAAQEPERPQRRPGRTLRKAATAACAGWSTVPTASLSGAALALTMLRMGFAVRMSGTPDSWNHRRSPANVLGRRLRAAVSQPTKASRRRACRAGSGLTRPRRSQPPGSGAQAADRPCAAAGLGEGGGAPADFLIAQHRGDLRIPAASRVEDLGTTTTTPGPAGQGRRLGGASHSAGVGTRCPRRDRRPSPGAPISTTADRRHRVGHHDS